MFEYTLKMESPLAPFPFQHQSPSGYFGIFPTNNLLNSHGKLCIRWQILGVVIDHITQLLGDRIDYATQLQGDRIDHVTQLQGHRIDHTTQLLSAITFPNFSLTFLSINIFPINTIHIIALLVCYFLTQY